MMCGAPDANEEARECDSAAEIVLRQTNIEAAPKCKTNRPNGEGKRWQEHDIRIA